MSNFSIVVITYNEEKNIEKCLSSVCNLSDDIIILDSFSTDKTKEICSRFNVNFISQKFEDYSTQKNFANSCAKYDFIFSIDADEFLSDTLKESIKSININDINENIAYTFNRLNHYCNIPVKFGGWYPDKKIRIWNKNYGQWQGKIHETIFFSQNPKYIHLDGNLMHLTYSTHEEYVKKTEKYAILNANKDFTNGKSTNIILIFLSTFFKFITNYIFKLGILDGKTGFTLAKISAFGTYTRKMELLRLKKHNNLIY